MYRQLVGHRQPLDLLLMKILEHGDAEVIQVSRPWKVIRSAFESIQLLLKCNIFLRPKINVAPSSFAQSTY